MVGERIAQYQIEAKLGEGAMGVVYRATDTNLGRSVALKVLPSGAVDSDLLNRFQREARAASQLQHPSIVTLYEFHIDGPVRYLAMEYVEGETLKSVIRGQPLPLQLFFRLAQQLADGIAEAHEKSVIHRDIKGDNIIVSTRGQAKILDFGLAKIKQPERVGGDQKTLFETRAGMMLGTMTHIAPEQALGFEVTDKADVFSLGVVFYEMITGKLPFRAETPAGTLALILDCRPLPPAACNPQLPPQLETLILRCLRKEAAERPTAREVARTLARISAAPATDLFAPKTQKIAIPTTPVAAEAAGGGGPLNLKTQKMAAPVSGALSASVGRAAQEQPLVTQRIEALPAGQPAAAPAMKTERLSRPAAAVVATAAQPSAAKAIPAEGVRSPQSAAAAPKPGAGPRSGVPAAAPIESQNHRSAYRAWHAFRVSFAVTTWIVPAAFVAFFFLTAAVRPDLLEGSLSYQFLRKFVQPILSLTEKWLPFRPTLAGWNFALLGLAALATLLRTALLVPLERWENEAMLRAGVHSDG